MQRFRAPSFAVVMSQLARAAEAIHALNASGAYPDDSVDRMIVQDALREAKPSLSELPFSMVITEQFVRLEKAAQSAPGAELVILLREFHNNVMVDLASAWFLMIPSTLREHYEQREPPLGEAVAARFPDAGKDIAAASRCLALDEGTACVFHLMRVLEHGLRLIAARFGVSFAVDSWHKVIKGIEDGIADLRNKQGLTEQDRKDITYYSEAASQFRYFKDAWRNHVTHAREHYDPREAEVVWAHVRELMRHLATPV